MTAPILVVQHPGYKAGFYDVVLAWAALNAPECVSRIEVRDLPLANMHWWSTRLFVPWLQDPVEAWSPDTYKHVEDLAAECDSRRIPVINRPRYLTNAGKALGAKLIATAGLRTPRTQLIEDPAAFRRDFLGFELPLFVREDWGHGQALCRADSVEEARAIPVEAFARPVVTEVVDVSDPRDGLHRKYRYFACGELGVTEHMQATADWISRASVRVGNDLTRAEELDYLSRQDRHHERFQAARRALGLDMVAFDYGYARDGEPVVWEANPFPHIHFSRNQYRYRNRCVHRAIGAMLWMYHRCAGLAPPPAVEAAASYEINPSFAEPAAAG